jgi:AraC-like DNA-binding protein
VYVPTSAPKNIPPYAALHLLSKVQEIGGDANAILRSAKLPLVMDDFERGAVPTLPHAHFTALYRECILQLEAHANQRSGRLSMELNETRMLYYCIINCRTLREAIVRSVEFFDMLDRGIRLRLEFSGDAVDFVMETPRSQRNSASFLSDLVGLASFHQFYGWMLGEPIAVRDIQMLYDPSFEKDIFMDFFQVPVRLGARSNRFRMAAEALDRPVVRSYHELEALLETFPLDIMPVDYKTGRIGGHVRNIMYNALLGRAVLPRIPDLAAAFGLSSATLRRRLADEGTSIGRIRKTCRRQLAEELLLNHRESIQGVAARLGFSDTTSFRRAFKQWTGVAPSKYRDAA